MKKWIIGSIIVVVVLFAVAFYASTNKKDTKGCEATTECSKCPSAIECPKEDATPKCEVKQTL